LFLNFKNIEFFFFKVFIESEIDSNITRYHNVFRPVRRRAAGHHFGKCWIVFVDSHEMGRNNDLLAIAKNRLYSPGPI
jgi:hypothetical protein